ncbi:MAG: hypothetical protein AB1631_14300 [Acidobacteriota bacterium]
MKKALIVLVLVSIAGCSMKVKQDEQSRIKLPDPSGKPVDADKPTGGQMPQVTAANEIAAMARLRSIATAEMAYFAEQDKYASLDELVGMGLLNDPSRGKLSGYRFDVKVKQHSFEATAVPEKFGATGRRSFYIDETGVMRAAERGGAAATASDTQV